MEQVTVSQVIESDIHLLEGMRLPIGEAGAIQIVQRVVMDLRAVMDAFRRDAQPAEPEAPQITAEIVPIEGDG